MNKFLSFRNRAKTAFVSIDTSKCIACWKCINLCPRKIIRKIDLPWHKHIIFDSADLCSGCYRCVFICKSNALIKTTNNEIYGEK